MRGHARALRVSTFLAVLCLPGCDSVLDERPATTPADLQAAERKVFSQFGEDGVIEKIFEVIEPGPKFAVEFGASDGFRGSNMRNLVLHHGWSSFQIEGNPAKAEKLTQNYADHPGTKTLHAWVWPGNIETLFEENGVPRDLDLLVIDIDSNDYYVWRAIHDFRPKVVIIEINQYFPPPQRMVIDFHPMTYWDSSYYMGASLQSLYELAKRKGYELIYQMSDGPNAFFVEAKYFDRFAIADNSPTAIFRGVPPGMAEKTKWGRNGIPWPEGTGFLELENIVIPKRFVVDR